MITRLSDLKLNDIRGVIFDLDGTLAHSNPDFVGLRAELGMTPGADILAYVDSLSDESARHTALQIVHDYEIQSSLTATWVEGARELIEYLQSQSLPLAILTRNIPEAALMTINKLGIDISLVLTRQDAQPKPHPEGIQLICQQWQLAPADILYVGDYLFDLQTAQNAGSRCALYFPDTVPDYAKDADLLVACYHSFIEAWNKGD
ncbi:HAD family hydrolase [Oceanisphaera profunda]|uniref:HAD family hydrolase n=1 Tax=Oceanisphaera profunda TaxID=1416627 RepID=A0A1Y0D902_9GAMM|nr:HAD-IA family hydrolase [Oceanisphaera profunda]ART84060.1 HAD family hydrolase [Oceanisphaera profunda]